MQMTYSTIICSTFVSIKNTKSANKLNGHAKQSQKFLMDFVRQI